MTETINTVESLIDRIKSNTINWTSLDYLKTHLRENGESLADVILFQLYVEHLRKDKFVFDCKESYFSLTSTHLYILSKKNNELEYRLDKFNYNSKKLWVNTESSLSVLLRLKNVILLTNSDTEDEYEKVLSKIKSINV